MIRRSQASHKDSKGKSYGPGHYDLVESNGTVLHFNSHGAALQREREIEYFKHRGK